MVSFGVFPGAALRDSLLAVAVYGPGDWARVFGGDPDGYQDYLIRQEEFVRSAYRGRFGPVRVVRVPFVREEFEAWLLRHPGLADCPDAHAAWVLEVAADPARVAALEERVGVVPRAVLEHGFVVEIWCLALAVPASLAWGLDGQLPVGSVEGACAVLEDLCRAAPPLVRVSAVRARGVGFAGGLSLVGPEGCGELARTLEGRVRSAYEAGEPPAFLHVPRRFRPRAGGSGWRVAAWPFAVMGAASEVMYATAVLEAVSSRPALDLAVSGLAAGLGFQLGPGWPASCLPLEELDLAVGDLLEAAEDLPEADPALLRAV